MGRHLAGCQRRQDQVAGATAGKPQPLIHLRMQDAYGGAYWFDAEVRHTATLEQLDAYLRRIWLECCGHMSKFSLGGWGSPDVPFRRQVGAAFADQAELTHVYDFGTESVTQVRAIGSRHGVPLSPRPIVLMARNLDPEATCADCDEPASHLCQECRIDWDSPGILCAEHAKAHPHEDYGEPIEIVNSPRLGRCGYTGPADPPY